MENLQSTYTHIVNKLRLLHTNNNNLSIFQTTDYKLSLIFILYTINIEYLTFFTLQTINTENLQPTYIHIVNNLRIFLEYSQ